MQMNFNEHFAVIGGNGNHDLDRSILDWINRLTQSELEFTHLDMDTFPDEEEDFRIAGPTGAQLFKDKHVIIFQSMHHQQFVNEFMTLAWSAKNEHGARSIIGVVPFLHYRRQDTTKRNQINRGRMLLENMKHNGIDHAVFCDLHSRETLLDCGRIGIHHYHALPDVAFAYFLRPKINVAKSMDTAVFVYAPDRGSVKRAVPLALELGVPVAVGLKDRLDNGEVQTVTDTRIFREIQGEYPNTEFVFDESKLADSLVIIREDEVNTGGTAHLKGWQLKREAQVRSLIFCATHPVCSPGWKRKFIDGTPYNIIYLGNTIPRPYRKQTGGVVTTVSMAQAIAPVVIQAMVATMTTNNDH